MKKVAGLVIALAVFLAGAAAFGGDDVVWLEDFEKAQEEAKTSGKTILANFSGSDWCGWCIRLDKEVLSKKVFKEYAEENLVLFVADFPSKKKQSDDLKKQNSNLSEKYGIKGFPTVLLIDKVGKVVATTGYQKGGPAKYIEHLKKLLKEDEEK